MNGNVLLTSEKIKTFKEEIILIHSTFGIIHSYALELEKNAEEHTTQSKL